MNSPNLTFDDFKLSKKRFQNIFLVQNRDYWQACPFLYDKNADLVLTFDYAVLKDITAQGGAGAYLDHLVNQDVMERYNHDTYEFLANWFYDKEKSDIFSHQGIKISNAFRLYVWTDVTYTVHILINLLSLRHLAFERLFVGIEDQYTLDVLDLMGLKTEIWNAPRKGTQAEYYFPIFRWMRERLYPSYLKRTAKRCINRALHSASQLAIRLRLVKQGAFYVFVQPYYPTFELIKRLKQDDRINLILESRTSPKEIFNEEVIPQRGTTARYHQLSDKMIEEFHERKIIQWQVEGIMISDLLYKKILEHITPLLPTCLRRMDDIISFFAKRPLKLMVTISNVGIVNCLVLNYCHKNKIPTYLIINGLFGSSYLDESKDAHWINAYGKSIKDNYFAGISNIVCLGDPRMDQYHEVTRDKQAGKIKPTISIGAAGFNNVDLNSYVAYEFEFISDILSACRELILQGYSMDIIVKVRSNGYRQQYLNFINEYYADLSVTVYDRIPVGQFLARTDLYISFYSQTLFEASCLGIPVLYYKNDTEIIDPPFDGRSELVTAKDVNDLVHKMKLFYQQDALYDSFLDRKVMEQYIGPLDGSAANRNMDFMYSLMSLERNTAVL